MSWLFFSISASAIWAVMNHFDKYLISRYCQNKSVGSLIIYSGLIGVPISFTIGSLYPEVFSLQIKGIIVTCVSGATYLCAMIPYLKALEKDDASIVSPLTQISSIISLILGYLVFGELLNIDQFIGIIVILVGSLGLMINWDKNSKFRFKNSIFLLMLLSSFFHSLTGILFKYVAIDADFWASAFWMYVGYSIYTLLLLLISNQIRKEFLDDFKSNGSVILSLNFVNELMTAIGNLAFNFAVILAPIGMVYFVSEGLQPFFVLMLGIILTIFFPNLGRENLLATKLIQKILSILLMVVGVYLINQ